MPIGDMDDPSGPLIKSPPARSKGPIEDNIKIIDISNLCIKSGLQWWHCRYLWFVKDVCGIICVVFTWLLLIYAVYVVFFIMLIPSPHPLFSTVNGIIFGFCSFMAFASHSRAMLTDPGAIPRGNATKEHIMSLGLREGEVVFKCPKCVCIKPERAHHCSVCRRCIKKMDHHCPWVNNCVGENNQKYFILFTLYICLISCHAIYMAINHFITCLGRDWKECSGVSPPATTVFLIFLMFEGLLFGIFTAIMLGTQLSAVCSDETGIEQLKKETPTWEKKSIWHSLKAVFGQNFSWHWFSPFSTPKYAMYHDKYSFAV